MIYDCLGLPREPGTMLAAEDQMQTATLSCFAHSRKRQGTRRRQVPCLLNFNSFGDNREINERRDFCFEGKEDNNDNKGRAAVGKTVVTQRTREEMRGGLMRRFQYKRSYAYVTC